MGTWKWHHPGLVEQSEGGSGAVGAKRSCSGERPGEQVPYLFKDIREALRGPPQLVADTDHTGTLL